MLWIIKNIISDASEIVTNPNLAYFAAGVPNPGLFPFESAEFKMMGSETIKIDSSLMKTSLQYGDTEG